VRPDAPPHEKIREVKKVSLLDKILASINRDSDNKPDVKAKENTVHVSVSGEEINEELVAAITAALACATVTPAGGLKIRAIKRLVTNAPVWSLAGRQTYLSTRL